MNSDMQVREALRELGGSVQPAADAYSVFRAARTTRRRRTRAVRLGVVSCVVAIAVAGGAGAFSPTPQVGGTAKPVPGSAMPAPVPDNGQVVRGVAGLEAFPSSSIDDWRGYAQAVIVAHPRQETVSRATATERRRKEGLVGRTVTLSVDQVLWSASGAPAVPGSLTVETLGYVFQGAESNRSALIWDDTPRIELGHSYVIALRWWTKTCEEGDVTPARWGPLGSQGVIPYDEGMMGFGEVSGQPGTRMKGEPGSVAQLSSGLSLSDLAQQLRDSTTAPKRDDAPAAAKCE